MIDPDDVTMRHTNHQHTTSDDLTRQRVRTLLEQHKDHYLDQLTNPHLPANERARVQKLLTDVKKDIDEIRLWADHSTLRTLEKKWRQR